MKRLILTLLLLLIPMWAGAATYYVDCNADGDAGSGLTTASNVAWKTIAKVNASSFSAGDSILFNRGCSWAEQLTVPSSGSIGNPITFGEYGSGAKPIINVSHLFGAGDWSKTAGKTNVYQAARSNIGILDTIWSSTWGTVFENSKYMSKQSDTAAVDANAGSCYYDGAADLIYIHTFGSNNPGTNGKDYRIPYYFAGISTNGKDYINVDSMDVHFACNQSVNTFDLTSFPYVVSDYINLSNIKVIGTSHNCFAIVGQHITLTSCETEWASGDNGNFVVADLGPANQDHATADVTFTDCTAGQNEGSTVALIIEAIESFTGVTINNFTVPGAFSSAVSAWTVGGGSSVLINGINITGATTGYAIQVNVGASWTIKGIINSGTIANGIFLNTVTGAVITQNLMVEAGSGIVIGNSSDIEIYYNVIKGGSTGIYLSDGTGHHVYNNVLTDIDTYGIRIAATPAGSANTKIQNNIVTSSHNGVWADAISLVLNYNMQNGNSHWGNDTTLAAFQALNLELNSSEADPLLVSATDFHLQSTSPCINAGTDVGLTSDYDGYPVPSGALPDIGAYEFGRPSLARGGISGGVSQ